MRLESVIATFMGILSMLPSFSSISMSDYEIMDYDLKLRCSSTRYYDDEDTLTYFYVNTNYEGETVTLVNADDMTEYVMVDDGKFSVSGDDLPYDGVYSLKMELDTTGVTYENNKILSFYAVTEDGSKSNTITITISKRFTSIQFEEMGAVDNKIVALRSAENYISASYDEKASMMYEVLTELALNGTEEYPYSLIQADSIALSDDKMSYEFHYYFGFSGSALIVDPTQSSDTEPITTTTTKLIETTTITTTTKPIESATTTTTATSTGITTTPSQDFFHGDCNNDGDFNVVDVVLLQKWLLAVPDTHLANWQAADFTEDDMLNVFDLVLMKKALLEYY